jgi:hypothetical protein
MGDRSEKVGERGQFFPDSRRIVDLCNEKIAGSDFSRQAPMDGGEAQGCAEQYRGKNGPLSHLRSRFIHNSTAS